MRVMKTQITVNSPVITTCAGFISDIVSSLILPLLYITCSYCNKSPQKYSLYCSHLSPKYLQMALDRSTVRPILRISFVWSTHGFYHYHASCNVSVKNLGQFDMPEACENRLSPKQVRSLCQPDRKMYQVLPYSVDSKAPGGALKSNEYDST